MEHGAKQHKIDGNKNQKQIELGIKLIGTDKTEQNKADGNKNNDDLEQNKSDGTKRKQIGFGRNQN